MARFDIDRMVIFNAHFAGNLLKACEEILGANPNMYVKGTWSVNERKMDEEMIPLYEWLTTDVTPVKLQTVVNNIKEDMEADRINGYTNIYLYN